MQNGFIKVAGVTPDVKVADCRYNADNIIAAMDEMARKRVALLVTPQLGITAHTCGDLFFQQALIAAAMEELLRIRDASAGSDMITVAGLPVSAGNGLYNAAAVVQNGQILGIVPKQTPPGYGEHDAPFSARARSQYHNPDRRAGRPVRAAPDFPARNAAAVCLRHRTRRGALAGNARRRRPCRRRRDNPCKAGGKQRNGG